MTTITIANPLIESFFMQNFSNNDTKIGEFISNLVTKEITLRSIKKGIGEAKNGKNLEDIDSFLKTFS